MLPRLTSFYNHFGVDAGLFSFKNYRFCVLLKVKIDGQVQRSKTHEIN